jgi:pimeloyl-ACP methyl ester carboxylesterase
MAGGRLGDWMTRFMARRAGCPSDVVHMSSCMAYPYYVVWFGGRESYRHHVRPFVPVCPFLFIYGTRKPIRFHSSRWVQALEADAANQVVAFDTGHWVMLEQPARFNEVVSDWLAR